MNIDQSIFAELSTILSGKVYPIFAQEGTLPPYITYKVNPNERVRTLEGQGNLVDSDCQIDIFHTRLSDLKTLTKSVISEIKSWNFTTLASTGTYIQRCDITEQVDTYDSETKEYQCTLDLTISYKEE